MKAFYLNLFGSSALTLEELVASLVL